MPRQIHGKTRTPEFHCWQAMRARCYNPKHRSYPDYGGRGITVCDAWRESFEAFLADVGERPSASHSLDRIRNDGDYEPGNVRWAEPTVQHSNTRTNVLITWQGRTQTQAQWCRQLGITLSCFRHRLNRGWSPERALTEPRDDKAAGAEVVTYNGQTRTRRQWSEETGIPYGTLKKRLNEGWPVERALTEPVRRWDKR